MTIKVPGACCTYDAEHDFIASISSAKQDIVLDMQGVMSMPARVLAFIVHFGRAGYDMRFTAVCQEFRGTHSALLSRALHTDFEKLIEEDDQCEK